ncbi:uncharacterized protein LOC129614877 [Condylostylus longicornis]|uniref:uncharacterized protein LOC129614877 n=1 Tax=Condylostylus longicornis TaxID=2530218 RepID=UPI00244E1A9F|nr:uncharacterized protein LOC129614877 [Condylostylus longicornis]
MYGSGKRKRKTIKRHLIKKSTILLQSDEKTKLIQSSILRSEEVSYNPIASLDNPSTIEFVSLGHGDTYRDLSSTYLRLKVKIVKKAGNYWNNDKGADGKTLPQPSVVNNLLHSILKQAYIESLLNYGTDAATTHLECAVWCLDKPNIAKPDNNGSKERQKLYHNSNIAELMGDADESQLKILEATLFMKHVTINPSVLLTHNAVLEKSNAKYNYKHVEVKSFTIPPNTSTISLDNVCIGQLPNTIFFCLTENVGYSGKRSKDPYNFRHFDMSQFVLYVNGVQVPNTAIETSFSDENNCHTRAYHILFSGTGIYHNDKGHQISKSMFSSGFFILAFDLTPDASGNEICQGLFNQGTIRIEARLSKAQSSVLTAIVYGEFDASVEIDKNRNIFTNL